MTKTELVEKISANSAFTTKIAAERVVNEMINHMAAALEHGEEIVLRNFGIFKVVDRDARMGRDPNTGEPVEIPAARVVRFSASKMLKTRLNETPEARDE